MVSINPASGPIEKPRKKPKKAPTGLRRGGRKPKEAGKRYERSFADKYDFRRQVGSGAFGVSDPMLVGDVVGEIGRLRMLFEAKSWEKFDARGEKVVTFQKDLLEKISREAQILGREPIFLYHYKGDTEEWAVVRYDWLHDLVKRWEEEILRMAEYLDG